MTIRAFWSIFLRILGLWLLIDGIGFIFAILSILFQFSFSDSDRDMTLAIQLLIIAFYSFVCWGFIFKTTWLIDKLHLEKGFDQQKIEIDIPRSTVLTIAIIAIGGFLLITSFPTFCYHLIDRMWRKSEFAIDTPNFDLIFYFTQTVAGYLIATKSRSIVNFIEKQSSNQP